MVETDGSTGADPAMASFLVLLARDMDESPEKIKPLGATRMKRSARLTKEIAVDLDEDLGNEVLL
jgi:hypothetical protein